LTIYPQAHTIDEHRQAWKNGEVIACLIRIGKVFMVNAGWKNSLNDIVTRIMKNHIET
jgi:hypothetical protein